jgi:ABC-type multidrug transport system fused ATPase/permease subunit
MSLFRQVYSLLPDNLKKRFWRLLLAMLGLALVETIAVGIIAFYAALISDPQAGYQSLVNFQFSGLYLSALIDDLTVSKVIAVFSLMLIVAVVIKNIYSGIITLSIAKYSATVESFFGSRLLESFLYQPYQWHLSKNSADLVQYVNWRNHLGRNFFNPALKVMTALTMLLVLLLGLMLVQPVVSLLFISAQAVAGFMIYRYLRKGLDRSAKGCRDAERQISRNTTTALHAIKDVHISNSQEYFLEKFRKNSSIFSQLFGKQQFWRESPLLALETVGFVLLVVVILFMLFVLEYSPLEMTGTTALLAVTAWRSLPAFNKVVSSMAALRASQPYVEKLVEEIVVEPSVNGIDVGGDSGHSVFRDKIEFRSVSFAYDEEKNVLDSLSLTIARGTSVGIMGPSGCGKSTFVDLLSGLLVPQKGAIEVDGQPLSDVACVAWRTQIGYVSQFPYVFDGTLSDNVAFGLPSDQINRQRVKDVCRLAAIDFLDQLPRGIDTMIGERGIKLSGGQRQRVAIARALYREASLIIFDEATSALDEATDFEICKLIANLKDEQTLVVVSHRPSTVAECDYILQLDKYS